MTETIALHVVLLRRHVCEIISHCTPGNQEISSEHALTLKHAFGIGLMIQEV